MRQHPTTRRRPLLAASAAALLTLRAAHPGARAEGTRPPPPFAAWVGRTALLSADGTTVRLYLAPDGTGRLALRVLGRRTVVAVRRWRAGPDGLSLAYRRAAALDPGREVDGSAAIDRAAGVVAWSDDGRAPRRAELLGFEDGDTTAAR